MLINNRMCMCLVFVLAVGFVVPFAGCESYKKTPPLISVLQQTTSAERAVLQTQRMVTKLNLSEEQIPKIHAINLDFANRAQAIAFADTSDDAKTQDLMRLLDTKDVALQQVLSTSQLQAYQQMKAAAKDNAEVFGG